MHKSDNRQSKTSVGHSRPPPELFEEGKSWHLVVDYHLDNGPRAPYVYRIEGLCNDVVHTDPDVINPIDEKQASASWDKKIIDFEQCPNETVDDGTVVQKSNRSVSFFAVNPKLQRHTLHKACLKYGKIIHSVIYKIGQNSMIGQVVFFEVDSAQKCIDNFLSDNELYREKFGIKIKCELDEGGFRARDTYEHLWNLKNECPEAAVKPPTQDDEAKPSTSSEFQRNKDKSITPEDPIIYDSEKPVVAFKIEAPPPPPPPLSTLTRSNVCQLARPGTVGAAFISDDDDLESEKAQQSSSKQSLSETQHKSPQHEKQPSDLNRRRTRSRSRSRSNSISRRDKLSRFDRQHDPRRRRDDRHGFSRMEHRRKEDRSHSRNSSEHSRSARNDSRDRRQRYSRQKSPERRRRRYSGQSFSKRKSSELPPPPQPPESSSRMPSTSESRKPIAMADNIRLLSKALDPKNLAEVSTLLMEKLGNDDNEGDESEDTKRRIIAILKTVASTSKETKTEKEKLPNRPAGASPAFSSPQLPSLSSPQIENSGVTCTPSTSSQSQLLQTPLAPSQQQAHTARLSQTQYVPQITTTHLTGMRYHNRYQHHYAAHMHQYSQQAGIVYDANMWPYQYPSAYPTTSYDPSMWQQLQEAPMQQYQPQPPPPPPPPPKKIKKEKTFEERQKEIAVLSTYRLKQKMQQECRDAVRDDLKLKMKQNTLKYINNIIREQQNILEDKDIVEKQVQKQENNLLLGMPSSLRSLFSKDDATTDTWTFSSWKRNLHIRRRRTETPSEVGTLEGDRSRHSSGESSESSSSASTSSTDNSEQPAIKRLKKADDSEKILSDVEDDEQMKEPTELDEKSTMDEDSQSSTPISFIAPVTVDESDIYVQQRKKLDLIREEYLTHELDESTYNHTSKEHWCTFYASSESSSSFDSIASMIYAKPLSRKPGVDHTDNMLKDQNRRPVSPTIVSPQKAAIDLVMQKAEDKRTVIKFTKRTADEAEDELRRMIRNRYFDAEFLRFLQKEHKSIFNEKGELREQSAAQDDLAALAIAMEADMQLNSNQATRVPYVPHSLPDRKNMGQGCARCRPYIKNESKQSLIRHPDVDRSLAAKHTDAQLSQELMAARMAQSFDKEQRRVARQLDLVSNPLTAKSKLIKFARSTIHGWGLFALEDIAQDSKIIEYIGELIREPISDIRERRYQKQGIGSSYLFKMNDTWVVDATKKGGVARFINHSCDPTCTARVIRANNEDHICIYALRPIRKNEEITYDYKFPFEEEKIECRCGSAKCRGSLN